VAFARSHVARGQIVSVDTEAAVTMPGVAAVFVASDLNHLVREWWVDLEGPKVGSARPFRLLAEGDVRFVGEPIAMVLADSRYQSRGRGGRSRDRHRPRKAPRDRYRTSRLRRRPSRAWGQQIERGRNASRVGYSRD
jgi:xanthine dehydrogenase molybdopterin-binding subunit B